MTADHLHDPILDIEELRQQLAHRARACLDRLDDAVSELYALHSFAPEEIIARVRAMVDAESTRS